MVGRVSPTEILQAGVQLLQACIIERGMGGLAIDLGELDSTDLSKNEHRIGFCHTQTLARLDRLMDIDRRGQQSPSQDSQVPTERQMRYECDPRPSVPLMLWYLFQYESQHPNSGLWRSRPTWG